MFDQLFITHLYRIESNPIQSNPIQSNPSIRYVKDGTIIDFCVRVRNKCFEEWLKFTLTLSFCVTFSFAIPEVDCAILCYVLWSESVLNQLNWNERARHTVQALLLRMKQLIHVSPDSMLSWHGMAWAVQYGTVQYHRSSLPILFERAGHNICSCLLHEREGTTNAPQQYPRW